MAVAEKELRAAQGARNDAEMVVDTANNRIEAMSDWKTRLDTLDETYRGDWTNKGPDGAVHTTQSYITNLTQVGLDDMSAMVALTMPSIRCEPRGDSDPAKSEAEVKEAAIFTHWEMNRAEDQVASWAFDIFGAGGCFTAVYLRPGFDYPAYLRLDPRQCFPTIHNGRLIDLVTVSKMPRRTFEALHGSDKLAGLSSDKNEWVEVLCYYGATEVVEVAVPLKGGSSGSADKSRAVTLNQWTHGLNRAPVAFAKLPTYDGAFRGMFDQIRGSQQIQNKIASLIIEMSEQAASAPIIGVVGTDLSEFGSWAWLKARTKEDADAVRRVEPAQVSPDLWRMQQSLERDSRAGIGYPATRQGEQYASIISATGMAATQGQLVTTIQTAGRLIGRMREDAHSIGLALERRHLNFTKPLSRPVGNKRDYTPEQVGDDYSCRVTYSQSVGVNDLNDRTGILQAFGAGLIDDELAMSHIKEVTDVTGAKARIQKMRIEQALLARFAEGADLPTTLRAYALMSEGKDLPEVVKIIQTEVAAQAAQAQQQQPGAPAAPAAEGQSPEVVAAQQTALQKGGVPGQAPTLTDYLGKAPTTSIFVK